KDPPQAASAPAPRDTPAAEEPPPKAPLPRLPSLTPPEGPIAGAAAATPAMRPPPMARAPQLSPLPRGEISSAQRWTLASIGMGVLIVAALIGHSIRSAAHLSPAAGSAEVVAFSSRVLASSNPGAKEIASLKRGARVNILRLPDARDQQWVEVQYGAGAKAYTPGFVPVADLGNWSSDKPDTALYLLQLFSPADSAPEAEIQAHLERLDAFVSRFGSTPQGPLANFERARFNLLLAERGKQAGQPAEIWQQRLDAATVDLAMAAAGADLGPKVESLRQQLEALKEKQ
ncbi:MAG TPA: SH3 domain-containing protein, partial [Bryobacterales bacterium]|nr:SH3 domain-containing protein [Bryobacterales bacterium]